MAWPVAVGFTDQFRRAGVGAGRAPLQEREGQGVSGQAEPIRWGLVRRFVTVRPWWTEDRFFAGSVWVVFWRRAVLAMEGSEGWAEPAVRKRARGSALVCGGMDKGTGALLRVGRAIAA